MGVEHWLQLSMARGVGPVTTGKIVAAFGSGRRACEAGVHELQQIEGIGQAKARSIAAGIKAAASETAEEIKRAHGMGIRIICPECSEYPPLLRLIPDPPAVLYVVGDIAECDVNAVAIVGSRKCSIYGREQAERFASLLSGAGYTVASGGARGIDSSAHRGAIAQPSGRTIAVLGSGLDVPYPPENEGLFRQIAGGHGAVLSEYALGSPPIPENFPRRNRIVSGISRGVLVVEADERSGALITARQCVDDHNRPVFAVPGRVDNALSAGPHELLRTGAILAAKLDDIIDGLDPLPDGIGVAAIRNTPSDTLGETPRVGLTERQRALLVHLSADPTSVDRLIERTELPAPVILQELTFLSLKGVVRRIDGQSYALRTAGQG